jgi:hypothetical protein
MGVYGLRFSYKRKIIFYRERKIHFKNKSTFKKKSGLREKSVSIMKGKKIPG